MRVLIVKMSSMGDIVHTLPAVNDAANALSGIEFDWVAEEAFIEIPAWHKNINRVIPIALRCWRKQPWHALKQGEVRRFYKQLRLQYYDKVLDAQGSIKSAVTTRLSRGFRVGMDKNSVRETLADLAYQEKFFIPRKQHAIERLRQLFAKALGYPLPKTPPCYGITKDCLIATKFELPTNYLVFVPNASLSAKRWAEPSWALLVEKTTLPIYIPWGNEAEKKCAMQICGNNQNVKVLPRLGLSELASLISHAKAAVCVDTGLSHLAAALDVPNVTLYGPTDPELIGTIGPSQVHLQSTQKDKLEISIETVWQALEQIIKT